MKIRVIGCHRRFGNGDLRDAGDGWRDRRYADGPIRFGDQWAYAPRSPPVVAGLPTVPHGLTAGLKKTAETCGRILGGVGRPAPNRRPAPNQGVGRLSSVVAACDARAA